MQKTADMQVAKKTHRRVQASTTLNRKYVKRPVKNTKTDITVNVKRTPKIQRYNTATMPQKTAVKQINDMAPAQAHPMQTTARARMQTRGQNMQSPRVSKLTAQELKERAIKKALASANNQTIAQQIAKTSDSQKKAGKIRFGIGRVVLALSCAAAAVFAIAYFVNLNMPDISLRVAAMQTGINATYPNYIPRDFKTSGIVSEDGKITINFYNQNTRQSFSLIEEKSSWDSNALHNNFVKEAYGDDYSIIREQGLTIYVSKSNAAWVNGGIVYKLEAENGVLTDKQISSIATSL